MRRALREPLVHFLALGTLLFLFQSWRGGGPGAGRVVVGAGQLQHLAAGFARTWQREPTDEELKALVDDHVREELAVREAVASGLDRGDTVVRRRLRQKVEFLAEDAADTGPPGEQEIQAWLAEHPEALHAEPVVALRHVFVSRERRRDGGAAEAARLLARLREAGPGADTSRLGDASSLPPQLEPGPAREVALTFGEGFARAVERLPVGEWSGPVESAYGLHLVLVSVRSGGGERDLATARAAAARALVDERRRRALDAHYQALLERHGVTIEWPDPGAAGPGPKGAR